MNVDWLLTIGIVFASLVVAPAVVLYVVLAAGPPAPGTTGFLAFVGVVMVPGLALGGTALWVAARG